MLNPATGQYEQPIAATPTKTAGQIAAESAASVAHTQAQTGAVETPQQRRDREREQIILRAQEDRKTETARFQAEIDAGLKLPEQAAEELKNALAIKLAQTNSELRQLEATAEDERTATAATTKHERDVETATTTFERERPFRERTAATAEESTRLAGERLKADTANQQTQNRQAQRRDQIGVLKSQADAGQARRESLIKSGIAPGEHTIRMAYEPLAMMWDLVDQGVSEGWLDKGHVPSIGIEPPTGQANKWEPPAPISP